MANYIYANFFSLSNFYFGSPVIAPAEVFSEQKRSKARRCHKVGQLMTCFDDYIVETYNGQFKVDFTNYIDKIY